MCARACVWGILRLLQVFPPPVLLRMNEELTDQQKSAWHVIVVADFHISDPSDVERAEKFKEKQAQYGELYGTQSLELILAFIEELKERNFFGHEFFAGIKYAQWKPVLAPLFERMTQINTSATIAVETPVEEAPKAGDADSESGLVKKIQYAAGMFGSN